MEDAIRKVDLIIERRGECIIGGIMEQVLGCDCKALADELMARGYVVLDSPCVKHGYIVYPKRRNRSEPWLIVEVI